ncbi:alpha/beta hydrolase [Streptomyces sp. NPDC048270]|uniref:alpha/beta hydrolase n=1 Tax=Streptomyces sp. NPDC048270 TaxID=3154615 RepID=UPI0033DD61CC
MAAAAPGPLSRGRAEAARAALRRSAVGALVLGLVAAGCTGVSKRPGAGSATPADGAGLRPFYEQKITWTACQGGGFACGRLKVPLDYAAPGGETIELALIRDPADDRTARIGSLVYNPGGPGGSGVEAVGESGRFLFSDRLRSRFDIVGFDPRGVGRSTAVSCLTDHQKDRQSQIDGTPDDQAEVDRFVASGRDVAAACRANTPRGLLAHVSTVEAARDMDVLRAALGDAKLHYLGQSYGTYLGAVYAEQFPARTGRLVLDAAIDPRMWPPWSPAALRAKAVGFETALDAFLADCVPRTDCPLGRDTSTARQRLAGLLQRADSRPLPGDGVRTVNESLAAAGVLTALFSKDSWPALRTGLAEAQAGNGSTLLALADLFSGRDHDGHYTNLLDANQAVNCLDGPSPTTTAQQVQQQLPALRQASPLFGTYVAWAALSCAFWPVRPVGTPREIKAAGAAPILVVGTTRDPATPYAWAQSLAGQLESGVLLTYDGDGHGAYRATGRACVTDAVDAYLTEGRLPAEGTRCR